MDATAIMGELVYHIEWADAVVFSVILSKPQAEEDEALELAGFAKSLHQEIREL